MPRTNLRPEILACVLFAPLLAWSSITPDWMRAAATKPQGSYPPDTHAVVLLDDATANVTGVGEMEFSLRRVVRILRPEGRNEGKLSVYLSAGDKVLAIHAWTIDRDGREYEVKDKEFIEVSPFHEVLYTDIKYRATEAPAPNPGAVIAFEYTVRRHTFADQTHWFFQEDIPVSEAHFTLQLPAGWEYKASWANQPVRQPVQLGPNRWQWTCTDLPGIGDEKKRPADGALAGHMELAFYPPAGNTTLGTWQAIGDWYYHLTDGKRANSPEIAAKVQQLTASTQTFDEKIRALAGFLQSEVRYVAIAIGIGGYQPHGAPDVFHSRYGDCKDKVTLLSAMLTDAGIGSEYVLVDTERGVVKPDVPSTLFNHAILAIELPADTPPTKYRSVVTTKAGKRYLIFDPTDEYTPIGDLGTALQGSYALLVAKTGGELIQLPVLPPDTNRFDREGKFTLQADGSISGTLVEKRTGDHASRERMWMADANEAERMKYVDHYLEESLRNVTVQKANFGDAKTRGTELVQEFQITAQNYAQHSGQLLLVRPRVLGDKGLALEWAKRKYPVELAGATQEKDVYEIQLPAGFVVDDLPEPLHIDVGFAKYSSKVESTGSTLRYSREYVITDPNVGSDRLGDLRKFENVIAEDEYANAVLKKSP
jgi:transglutaminase-like putative cysteine protease